MRAFLGGLVACSLPCAASAVQGHTEPPTAVDKRAHVRFTLDRRLLRVRVGPDAGTRRMLFGKRIDATCNQGFAIRPGSRVIATRVWPAGSTGLTFTFDRDISRTVKWCLLERGATDVSYATFGPSPGRIVVRTSFDESGGTPIEGALQYLRLRDGRGRVLFVGQVDRLGRAQLSPGRYGLATWWRVCGANCHHLGRPDGYANRRFRVRSSKVTRLRVTVNYSRGSRISVVR